MNLIKTSAGWEWAYFWENISKHFAYDPKQKQWWGWYDETLWVKCDPRDVPEELVKNQKVLFG